MDNPIIQTMVIMVFIVLFLIVVLIVNSILHKKNGSKGKSLWQAFSEVNYKYSLEDAARRQES